MKPTCTLLTALLLATFSPVHADMAPVGAQKMAAGLLASSHHQEELPR